MGRGSGGTVTEDRRDRGRQVEPERSAGVGLALHLNRPLVRADHAEGFRETEPPTDEFRAEERLEDSAEMVRINAATGIGNLDHRAEFGGDIRRYETLASGEVV